MTDGEHQHHDTGCNGRSCALRGVQGRSESSDPLHGQEVCFRGIRANAASPGAIRTDLENGLTDDFENLLASQTAFGRVREPDAVGCTIASLLSDDNRWINAQTIEVAGGYMI